MFRVYGFRIIFMRIDINIFDTFAFDLSICVYSKRIKSFTFLCQYSYEPSDLVTSRCIEKEVVYYLKKECPFGIT